MAASQPLDLRAGVTVDGVALGILEIPGDDDQDIPSRIQTFFLILPLIRPIRVMLITFSVQVKSHFI